MAKRKQTIQRQAAKRKDAQAAKRDEKAKKKSDKEAAAAGKAASK